MFVNIGLRLYNNNQESYGEGKFGETNNTIGDSKCRKGARALAAKLIVQKNCSLLSTAGKGREGGKAENLEDFSSEQRFGKAITLSLTAQQLDVNSVKFNLGYVVVGSDFFFSHN